MAAIPAHAGHAAAPAQRSSNGRTVERHARGHAGDCTLLSAAVGSLGRGIPGSIKAVEPTGPDTFLTVSTELGTFTVRTEGTFAIREDERVALDWDGRDSLFFDAETESRT